MRVWLDDIRSMPPGFDVHVTNAMEAMKLITLGKVTHISFDHDLGLEMSGYAVACCIEAAAYANRIPRMTWAIHSANPVGRANIKSAMERANYFWEPEHCVICGDWFQGKMSQGAGDGRGRKFACYPECPVERTRPDFKGD